MSQVFVLDTNKQPLNPVHPGYARLLLSTKQAAVFKRFQTGDIIRAIVTRGTKQGTYVGRVLIRASGSFDIRTKQGRVQGVSHRFCTPVHRCDGYKYQQGTRCPSPA